MVAEVTLRTEIPRPSLVDLLDLTALIALKDPGRRGRVTARWLARWLGAADQATIEEAALVASLLQALGGKHHEHAYTALRDMAEEVTSLSARRRVAS